MNLRLSRQSDFLVLLLKLLLILNYWLVKLKNSPKSLKLDGTLIIIDISIVK